MIVFGYFKISPHQFCIFLCFFALIYFGIYSLMLQLNLYMLLFTTHSILTYNVELETRETISKSLIFLYVLAVFLTAKSTSIDRGCIMPAKYSILCIPKEHSWVVPKKRRIWNKGRRNNQRAEKRGNTLYVPIFHVSSKQYIGSIFSGV